jgi:hypothetical protein
METIIDPKAVSPVKVACPNPFRITLDATVPYADSADFLPRFTSYQTALGYTGNNKVYAHTFVWKPNSKCCKVTSAVLTVKMKSNSAGTAGGADAGNDSIAVTAPGGASVLPFAEKVYSNFPFPKGTLSTKTWNITGPSLDKLNTANTLSFVVEDDTSVLSATLVLTGCCL